MRKSCILAKTIVYGIYGLAVGTFPALATADEAAQVAKDELRTEVKASLAPPERAAQQAAEAVGKAIAAEILATGLKTERLKPPLESAHKPRKVLASKTDPATASSGQSDQT